MVGRRLQPPGETGGLLRLPGEGRRRVLLSRVLHFQAVGHVILLERRCCRRSHDNFDGVRSFARDGEKLRRRSPRRTKPPGLPAARPRRGQAGNDPD
tara:strand:+ start:119 stop:409 length:291 start_codon:yes stop_codon:yes gene_type:complete